MLIELARGILIQLGCCLQPTGHGSPVNGYAAARGITGSLLIALNFFFISTCSYFLPMPGVLWPVIASEIRSGIS
jgi:hypothetical protein